MDEYRKKCPRRILGDICTFKTEYIYLSLERCDGDCEYMRKIKRKLAKQKTL